MNLISSATAVGQCTSLEINICRTTPPGKRSKEAILVASDVLTSRLHGSCLACIRRKTVCQYHKKVQPEQ
jgi:hypothetical protein